MWVRKYKPKKLEEVAGNKEELAKLKPLIKSKKAVMLAGETGVGKTCAVEALANEIDADLIEMNASDVRTKNSILEKMMGAAVQQSLFQRPKILLIDEADGLRSSGEKAIYELIKKSHYPVIVTANDPWSLRLLKNTCTVINMRRPTIYNIRDYLKKIAQGENIEVEDAVLKQIASSSGRDLRAAINDFENISSGKSKVTMKDLDAVGWRDRETQIFDAMKIIFKTMKADTARRVPNNLDVDPNMLMLWIEENIPREYENKEDIALAYDAISRADVFAGRIRRRQDWGLMKYQIDMMTVGVALAKKEMYRKFTRYFFPRYIKMLSKSRAVRNARTYVLKKIGEHCHCSSSQAMDYIPLIKLIGKKLDFLEPDDLKVVKKL